MVARLMKIKWQFSPNRFARHKLKAYLAKDSSKDGSVYLAIHHCTYKGSGLNGAQKRN